MTEFLTLLGLGSLTALACGLGAIPVFVLGDRVRELRPLLWGLAAGLMTLASVVGLLLPALDAGSAAAVDHVLTVNTVYFWSDLGAAFDEVRRVLAPGGRLVVAIRDMKVMQRLDPTVFSLRSPEELAAALQDTGFAEVKVETPPGGKTHLIVATR